MSKPLIHAQANAEKYGGKATDYIEIHNLIDSSKVALGDKRHRTATHNSWFIYSILPKIFGNVITNSDGKEISVTQIGEDHVLEDYDHKFIPTLEDFLLEIPMRSWMDNGNGYPPSSEKLFKNTETILDKPKENFPIFDDWRSMPLDVKRDRKNSPVFYKSIASD
jgi:hypothetical protein